jgi:hypothetical protein
LLRVDKRASAEHVLGRTVLHKSRVLTSLLLHF